MQHPIVRGWLSEISTTSVRDRTIISELKDLNYPDRGNVPLAMHLSMPLGADDAPLIRCQSFAITLTAQPDFQKNCWVVKDHTGRRPRWELLFEEFPTLMAVENRMVAIAEAINTKALSP
jgi:hypothetical protein